MDFKKLAYEKKEELLNILAKLISFASVLDEYKPNSDAPFGLENKKALEYILAEAKKDGFQVLNSDNYAGHIEYGDGVDILGILCHLDVVPAIKEEWTSDPFRLRVLGDMLYARGVLDDKGPLVAAYLALKLLKENNIKLNKKVRLIMGCDEESGSRCLKHYFKNNEMPSVGFSPDAEFPVIYGEKANVSINVKLPLEDDLILDIKGGTRLNVVPSECMVKLSVNLKEEFETFLKENNYDGKVVDDYTYITYGKASHAMQPQNGINAISLMFKFLGTYASSKVVNYYNEYLAFSPFGDKLGLNVSDLDMGNLTMNVAMIEKNNNFIDLKINYRIPVDNYTSKIKEAFNKSFKELKAEVNVLSESNLHYVPKDSSLVKTLLQCYQDITSDNVNKPFTIGGGTYAQFIKNAVAFGPLKPGQDDCCHIANEHININDLLDSIAIYAKAIYLLGNSDETKTH